jgi:hypothetical protein
VIVEVDTFCRKFVEPMGEESDHIHIVALCDALQVPVRVLYLDNSGAMMLQQGSSLEVNSHDFVPRQVSAMLSCCPASPSMLHPHCTSPTCNVSRAHCPLPQATACSLCHGSTNAH